MYKILRSNARFRGSWRSLPDGPKPDRMPQGDAHLPCPSMLHDLVSRVQKALAVPAFAKMHVPSFVAPTDPAVPRCEEVAYLASREGRHLVRIRLISVLRRVRPPGFTTGSMPRALISVRCGGALSGSRAPARTKRSRLFASGAVRRKCNAGNDLGLNARWCHESGNLGKFGRVEERELLSGSAVQGDPAVEPFPRQDRGHRRHGRPFLQGVADQ